jgi:hypothetical protein
MPMRLSLVLAAAALVLAACGGSSSTLVAAPDDRAPEDATTRSTAAATEASSAEATASNGDQADGDQADGEPGSASSGEADTSQPAAEDTPTTAVTPEEAAERAAANQPNLVVSDSPIDTQVLVVADGTVTSLADAVTGDRPLLIWFWAPH